MSMASRLSDADIRVNIKILDSYLQTVLLRTQSDILYPLGTCITFTRFAHKLHQDLSQPLGSHMAKR